MTVNIDGHDVFIRKDKASVGYDRTEGGRIPFPAGLALSQNWTPQSVAEPRKLKNVFCLLKAQPKAAAHDDAASTTLLVFSLAEAQAFRHVLNCGDAKLAGAIAQGEVDLLLTTIGGLPLTDPTAFRTKAQRHAARGFAPSGAENEMVQSARFLDSQVFFKTHELVALIDATAGVDGAAREEFFRQLISSRKRA